MTRRPTPVTELPNELTGDLDLVSTRGFVRLLRQSDAQLFAGWREHPALSEDVLLEKYAQVAMAAAGALAEGPNGVILLSGAGTSGRVAHLVCRQFNRLLREAGATPSFRPLVAGGFSALVRSREHAEDDPEMATAQLNSEIPDGATSIVYCGITCGLSATCIAAQLESLRDDPRAFLSLVGFNPEECAVDRRIEGWDRTFASVLDSIAEREQFALLNPVYGPEPVKGSTRMKGGSATKIILESVFYTALEIAGLASPDIPAIGLSGGSVQQVAGRIRLRLAQYRDVMHSVYNRLDILEDLVRAGGSALRSGGTITYLGRETAGILGLIDASECPPTFGARFDDVRGYLRDGWDSLLDVDVSATGENFEFDIGFDGFVSDRLDKLSRGDLVIGLSLGPLGPQTRTLRDRVDETDATAAILIVTDDLQEGMNVPESIDRLYIVEVTHRGFQPGFPNLAEFGLKLCLNALTTGAFVQNGKVYGNQMIDLRISNQKLYWRSLGTIQQLAGVGPEEAHRALHRAVYRTDNLTPDQNGASPPEIINECVGRERVVPTALLLAGREGMSYDAAAELLGEEPIVRRAIERVVARRE